MRRALTDRFWQAGISTESREDFFARVSSSKTTYEGFASTIRGTVRQIRESTYYILYSLTRFKDSFYGIPGLAEPFTNALFGNASTLSAHHLSVLLSLATHIIEGCPAPLRPQFLPPFINGLFRTLNSKITPEWERLNVQTLQAGENDNLTDEMKTESILRQLTFSSVSLIALLVDPRTGPYSFSYVRYPFFWWDYYPYLKAKPQRIPAFNPTIMRMSIDVMGTDDRNAAAAQTDSTTTSPAAQKAHSNKMCEFIINSPEVLETLLLFCNSMLRVRDTRSVSTVVHILRRLIPRFKPSAAAASNSATNSDGIRQFFASQIFKSAISSLHESYFVDCQKDLASLIANIILLDENTTRGILLSLPGLGEQARTDRRLARLRDGGRRGDERFMRSVVLDLLAGVRGVSVSELGKVEKGKKRKEERVGEKYMVVDVKARVERGGEEMLEGVAGMFDDA